MLPLRTACSATRIGVRTGNRIANSERELRSSAEKKKKTAVPSDAVSQHDAPGMSAQCAAASIRQTIDRRHEVTTLADKSSEHGNRRRWIGGRKPRSLRRSRTSKARRSACEEADLGRCQNPDIGGEVERFGSRLRYLAKTTSTLREKLKHFTKRKMGSQHGNGALSAEGQCTKDRNAHKRWQDEYVSMLQVADRNGWRPFADQDLSDVPSADRRHSARPHRSSKSKVAIHGNAIAGPTPDDARLIACVSALVGKRVLPASTGSRSNLQRVYQA